jgi:hypothetical protein
MLLALAEHRRNVAATLAALIADRRDPIGRTTQRLYERSPGQLIFLDNSPGTQQNIFRITGSTPGWAHGVNHDVTRTSTDIPAKASAIPTKLPDTGIACRMSRTTATGIRLKPPTLRLVGSNVIQPAPGT